MRKLPILGVVLLIAVVLAQGWDQNRPLASTAKASVDNVELGAFPILLPTLRYGFAIDTFQLVQESEIQPNQFLADLLSAYRVDYPTIEKLVRNAKPVFDVRQLRVGKPFLILGRDSTTAPDYFIYEPSVFEYFVFHLKDSLYAERIERPIDKAVKTYGGRIESSLWEALAHDGIGYELALKLEDALQWSVDFHHVLRGDEFKIVYEEQSIEGKPVGVSRVMAAWYKNLGTEHYAIWFEHPEYEGFYDEEGRPMDKGFLRAPVKYSRISSRYNPRRFHPILKRVRPHLGTDYAAPYGTPILAVGDGVVLKAGYTRGNGNYVKIKHNDTYQTQYLHMQKFAKGIRPGVHVKQGQVIGYVGSTGLATGPHVCFRFWKNGRQVNHLRLTFPPPKPLPEEILPEFFKVRDAYLAQLEAIALPETSDEQTHQNAPEEAPASD